MKSLGLVHKRTSGSHEILAYPDESKLDRPVVFRGDEKEIPPTHVRTNLRTLGLSSREFEERTRKL
ncbi:MAG: type II toxin-antitoxin system HicA family toxin [candidate division WOR-3 bacterium]|nr:type II toxin-antitoxin system HicA family toxin [candidate division WOR-3 bacterium]